MMDHFESGAGESESAPTRLLDKPEAPGRAASDSGD